MSKIPLDKACDLLSEIAEDITARESIQVDQEAQWPEESIRALQASGLGGLVVPEESGGMGFGLLGLARACEILGRKCASTALCFGMHSVGSAVIAAKATDDQKQRYLEPIAAGEHLTTLALSEPGTGAHFYYPETRLEHATLESYQVNGRKCFVTNGGHADSYVISTVASDPDAPLGQFSFALVDRELEGLEWGEKWSGLGMRGNSSRVLTLSNVTLPRKDILGDEGDQIWYVFYVVGPYFLTAMAGTYLGLANAAFEEAREHLRTRRYSHSGNTLSQASVLQHRLGSLWGKVVRAQQLLYYAARQGDVGGSDALPILFSAKAEIAETAVDVVNECMTLCGGIGYADGSKLGRLLRDVRAAHIMSPTTDILRVWTGRSLLGLPLLEE